MINIIKIEQLNELSTLKTEYINQATAPLDGMWLCGFVPMAEHFGFYKDDVLIGFCCINSDGYLLQFYVNQSNHTLAEDIFTSVINKENTLIGDVNGAFSSTAETHYLSLCLDHAAKNQVNTLMFQQIEKAVKQETYLPMVVATVEQLTEFVEFAKANIGAPEEWVTGYYANLISRQELFGYWKNNELLAAGECRLFDEHQTDYADLGMVVAESERGKSIATQVLTYLISLANSKGLTAMCSTEKTNIASQKAITRAGLISSHRIVQFTF
ncbi:GNAT family N-acetyltransferase [Aliivibrio salmonicida]|uniref:GNAT family N-acetyltransferase n=1 Tax=Aliivibrio salmonicida TaxID=40269 RepID=UPI00406D1CAC